MMSLGTYISIGLLVLCTATIAMAAGLKGWTAVHQESDEAVRAACTGGDPFTLSGYAGNSAYDGCYMISCSKSNLRLYTLNGQDESLGGLIVSAPEHVDSKYLTYWTIREEGGNNVCGGSKFQTSVNGSHPTQVEKWKCYGGSNKDRELPVKPTLSLSCGCPNVDVSEVKEAVYFPEVEATVYVPEVEEVYTAPAHGLDIFVSASFVVALLAFSFKSCSRRTSLRRYFKPTESGQ